jgi:hypothetical protein
VRLLPVSGWLRVTVAGVVAVVILLVTVGVYNWGADRCLWKAGAVLGPLVHDPLAAEDLLGLELIHSSQDSGRELSNIFSKAGACLTLVTRSFEPGPDGEAGTLNRIVEFAEENGWWVSEFSRRPGHVSVDLRKPYSDAKSKSASVRVADVSMDDPPFILLTIKWGMPL